MIITIMMLQNPWLTGKAQEARNMCVLITDSHCYTVETGIAGGLPNLSPKSLLLTSKEIKNAEEKS